MALSIMNDTQNKNKNCDSQHNDIQLKNKRHDTKQKNKHDPKVNDTKHNIKKTWHCVIHNDIQHKNKKHDTQHYIQHNNKDTVFRITPLSITIKRHIQYTDNNHSNKPMTLSTTTKST